MSPETATVETTKDGKHTLPLSIKVKLVGQDGNAFMVLGSVYKAMRRAGYGDYVAEFNIEAMNGNYDHLLQTAMRWVDVV